MRASLIKVRNILGVTELVVEPKKFTVISGQNASGKTSVHE